MSELSRNPETTSTPPEFTPEQEGFFVEVLRALKDHCVPHAVAGAFALHQCTGIWRSVKDLDICLTADAVSGARTAIQDQGFEVETLDPVWLAKIRSGDSYIDLITGMSNGVLIVDCSWIERAPWVRILGVHTRVLAPEELLVSKLFVARRDRFDGADVAHIIFRTSHRLDWNRVLSLVGKHWELLLWSLVFYRYAYPAHSEAVPAQVWRSLLDKFTDHVQRGTLSSPFRGSLIDDNAFAIDVNEWKLDDLVSEYRRRAPKIDTENDGPHSSTE